MKHFKVICNHLFLFVFVISLSHFTYANEIIKIGNTHALLTGIILLAEEKNFFKQEGINVKVVPLKTGADGLKGINDNTLQIYNASDVTFIKHFHKNNNLKVLATIGEWGNETKVLARKDKSIQSAKDLKGKRIAVHKGLAMHWFFDLLLRRNGLTENDVELHYIHLADQPNALALDQVDALVSREPFLTEGDQLLNHQSVTIEAPGLMMKRFILITSDEYLQKNTKHVIKILKGLYKAERYITEHPDEMLDLLAKIFNKNKNDIKDAVAQMYFRIHLDDHLLYTLEKVTKWWQSIEAYKNPVDYNFLEVIKTEPLKQAKPHGVLMHR